MSQIPTGPELKGVYLAAAPGYPAIYLVTSQGKRWITSPDALNKFYFSTAQIDYLPLRSLQSIPNGPDLT